MMAYLGESAQASRMRGAIRGGTRCVLYRVNGKAETLDAIIDRTGRTRADVVARVSKLRARGVPVTWAALA